MKYLFITSLSVLFSCKIFATTSPVKKMEPGNPVSEITGKTDSAAKKTARLPPGNGQQASTIPASATQKFKKERVEENADYYGPLSWRPALLY
jgi:hypothetical protein